MYYEFTLSSGFPMDIYISAGWQSDPNDFQYDMAFKQQNYVKLNSRQFPSLDTFVAAVKINGIDHYNTVFHANTLTAAFRIRTTPSLEEQEFTHDSRYHQSLSMEVENH